MFGNVTDRVVTAGAKGTKAAEEERTMVERAELTDRRFNEIAVIGADLLEFVGSACARHVPPAELPAGSRDRRP